MSTTVIHKPLTDTKWDKATARAQNTPCGVEGCNGSQHEAFTAPADQVHEVVLLAFDNGTFEGKVDLVNGKPEAFLGMKPDRNSMTTAAALRERADEYEAFPAWLRSLADRIDALNSDTAAL